MLMLPAPPNQTHYPLPSHALLATNPEKPSQSLSASIRPSSAPGRGRRPPPSFKARAKRPGKHEPQDLDDYKPAMGKPKPLPGRKKSYDVWLWCNIRRVSLSIFLPRILLELLA